jgi:ribosomal-protein-alanine N-acetyltransferase
MAGPGARVLVRKLSASDESVFVSLAEESLAFHKRWIKVPREPESFRRYLSRSDDQSSVCFVVCDAGSDSIVGFVRLSGIEREPYCRGRLGYGVFHPYARMGYISAGLRYVIRLAFEDLELHRLEADIQAENIPSRRLVASMGFTCEGVSRGFIRINDVWTDHERWAITLENWREWPSMPW